MGLAALRGLGDTVSCPLADGEGEAGVLVLVRQDGHRRFGADDIAGAEGFAVHASLSLRLAAERRRGESRVLLDERARIARDLHDLAVQQLFAVGIELGRVREALPVGDLAARVDAALGGLDTAVDHIRTTLRPLRPLRPDSRTVSPQEQIAATVGDAAVVLGFQPLLTDRTGPDETTGWDPVLLHDLLAALAEALANVARHARASSAQVVLDVVRNDVVRNDVDVDGRPTRAGLVRLVVQDDGIGLPAVLARSSGLDNLTARARQHGGGCTVRPRPSGGTRVEWTARLR